MGIKYESEFYEDRDTVTAITDIGEISKDDMWEVYDKKRRTFIDKSKWSNDAVATWLADLQMWTGKVITAEDYRKILGDKAKESKVLKRLGNVKAKKNDTEWTDEEIKKWCEKHPGQTFEQLKAEMERAKNL